MEWKWYRMFVMNITDVLVGLKSQTPKLTWQEIAKIMESKYGITKSPTAWKKVYQRRSQKQFDTVVKNAGLDPNSWGIKPMSLHQRGDKLSLSYKVHPKMADVSTVMTDILQRIADMPGDVLAEEYVTSNEIMAIVSIYDLHLQKMGVFGSSVNEVTARLQHTLSRLISHLRHYTPEVILFPLGNDWSNSDNIAHTTTAGTPQTDNMTWQFGIDKQVELAIYTINQLVAVAPVNVLLIPGNHDIYSNYFLGHVVEAYFRNNPNVTVVKDHSPRKYIQYGVTGIMFQHGDVGKLKSYSSVFASERPFIWGNVKFREAHIGHLHKQGEVLVPLSEEYGFLVRYMPSLSVTDNWHYNNMYVGNRQLASVLLYDKITGFFAQFCE